MCSLACVLVCQSCGCGAKSSGTVGVCVCVCVFLFGVCWSVKSARLKNHSLNFFCFSPRSFVDTWVLYVDPVVSIPVTLVLSVLAVYFHPHPNRPSSALGESTSTIGVCKCQFSLLSPFFLFLPPRLCFSPLFAYFLSLRSIRSKLRSGC